MSSIWLVARRDLRAYLDSAWGWVIIAAVLFIDGLLFNAFAMGQGARLSTEVLENFFYFSSGTIMIAAVLLTMRLFAEEKQAGTMVLLDSSPLSSGQLVAGKFLSAYLFLALLTVLTVYMPALIFVEGKVSVAHVATGYLGLLLLGAAATAIGSFGSSLVRSQVVAAMLSGVLVTFFVVCWMLSRAIDPPFANVIAYLSFFDKHFVPFMRGRIETGSVCFLLSVTWLFLLLTTRVVESRRWQ